MKIRTNGRSRDIHVSVKFIGGEELVVEIKNTNPKRIPGVVFFEATISSLRDVPVSLPMQESVMMIEGLKTMVNELDGVRKKSAATVNVLIDADAFDFNMATVADLLRLEEVWGGAYEFFIRTRSIKNIKLIEFAEKAFPRAKNAALRPAVNPAEVLFQSLLGVTGYKKYNDFKVLVIDTHNLFHRAYHAMHLKSKEGVPTSVVYAMLKQVAELNKERYFTHVVFASDSSAGSFRKNLYPEYKANRGERDESLVEQIEAANLLLEKMGLYVLAKEDYEADDVIASVAKVFGEAGSEVVISTTDKDMNQLITDNVRIYNPMKKVFVDKNVCIEKFGVRPDQFADYLALVGDASDNVPGAKNIGPKKAASLLSEYSSLEGIYENVDKLKGAVKKNIEESRENVFMSKKLVETHDYLFFGDIEPSFIFPKYNPLDLIRDEMKKLDINL